MYAYHQYSRRESLDGSSWNVIRLNDVHSDNEKKIAKDREIQSKYSTR